MQMKNLPKGLWPVMITAFKSDNSLDLDGVRKLTDMYLDAGVNGMFANCLSSEMFQLNREERLQLIKTVVDHCDGKVPVVASGSFYEDARENAAFIKEVYDLGVHAVILMSSVLVEPEESDASLINKIEAILELTGDIPLGMYECPVPYKRVISTKVMEWLTKTNRFWYHKDTTCDADLIAKKLEITNGTQFNLYNADTPSALASLRAGAKGISPISGNFYPELYSLYLKLFYDGAHEELEKLNYHLTVMDKITHDFYPWSAKQFLVKRGMGISTNSRVPVAKMTTKDKNIFQGLFDMFKALMDRYEVESVI